jgi:hypothetical protein
VGPWDFCKNLKVELPEITAYSCSSATFLFTTVLLQFHLIFKKSCCKIVWDQTYFIFNPFNSLVNEIMKWGQVLNLDIG